MKITIELTDAQVAGILEYREETGSKREYTRKEAVTEEINGIVQGYLQTPHSALTDYILKYENATR